jgi:2-dehydro-3-deoxygluconokinase
MSYGLKILKNCELDFLSLGALVERLDPRTIPFRKATEYQVHVSGGEFNVAANLSDCFGLKTGIASAIFDYPIGELIAERVRAMGVKPFYKYFKHDGVTGPNMATVYSDRGIRRTRSGGLLQPVKRSGGPTEAGGFRLESDLCRRSALGA